MRVLDGDGDLLVVLCERIVMFSSHRVAGLKVTGTTASTAGFEALRSS